MQAWEFFAQCVPSNPRAYAIQGDTTRARIAYNDFLTLWKEADPDIPILRQAKSEYGKLQSLLAVETSH